MITFIKLPAQRWYTCTVYLLVAK